MPLENYAGYLDQFDPLKADQAIAGLRTSQQQNRLADLTYGENQKEISDTAAQNNAYRNALSPEGILDRNKLDNEYIQSGQGTKLPALRKAFLENDETTQKIVREKTTADKNTADAAKSRSETAAHQLEIAGQIAGAWANDPIVNKQKIISGLSAVANAKIIDPAIYDAKMKEIEQLGDDPASLNQWAKNTVMQVIKAKDQIALTTPDANAVLNANVSTQNNALTNATSRENNTDTNERSRLNNAATVGATIRGQDVRAKSDNANLSKPFEVTGADGKPVLVRQDKQGNIMPVEGYKPKSGSSNLTENQGKATALGMRAIQSEKEIQDLNSAGFSQLSLTDRAAGAVPFDLAKGAMSNQGQKFENAQRNFISAVLRKESGAAITNSEFDNERKKYFPQVGDSDGVKEQKAKLRGLAIQGLQAEAGDQGTQKMLSATGSQQPAPSNSQPVKNVVVNGAPVNAKLAPDGHYYVKQANGKFARVD